MNYVMESENESDRLVAQQEADAVQARLIASGLSAGQRALDAGCGPGIVSEVMSNIVGPSGAVTGIDVSDDSIRTACERRARATNLRFTKASILETGLPSASFDYAWSQFVFEYLPQPAVALKELMRVTRSGGKIVVSDVDGAGILNWPMSQSVDQGIQTFLKALAPTGFNLNVGRTLFHQFKQHGLREVKVHLFPFYVIAGSANARLLEDWRVRFSTLEKLVAPAFGGSTSYQQFCSDYLTMLKDDSTLKYGVVLVTEGLKP